MADAIDNLAIDLNQANTVDEFPGYPGYKMGDLVPNMGGVRIGDTDFYGTDAYGQKAPYNWRTGRFEYAAPPTPPADTDSQFESYLAGIKDLQAPVSRPASSPNQPYTPTFTPMAAPPAVRVYPPANFGPVTASGYAQPPVDPMSYYSNPSTASLSNPSTLGGGSEIDYNIPDDPTIRVNVGNTDEQDARVYTPRNQEQYIKGNDVLVPPDQAGGFVGVQYLDPSEVAAITAGQTPSVPQGVETPGKTVLIPGRGLPDYRQSVDTDGNISYINKETGKVDFILPGVPGYPGVVDLSNLPEVISNVGGGGFRNRNRELSTPMVPFQETATPVESYEPTAASVGGFDNTGGNVSVGPDNRAAGPGDAVTVYIPEPGGELGGKPGEPVIAPFTVATPDTIEEVKLRYQGWKIDKDGNYLIWKPFDESMRQRYGIYGQWILGVDPRTETGGETETPKPPTPGGGGTPKPPKPGDEGTTTTTPTPGTGTGTTPTPGGGGQPGGGGRPGTGTGTGTYTGTPLPTREPVIPLVRKETVIPTKGTKEVPLPDRQADPFAKLYADLLANSQQQQDQYRYINYDPDQIMNAAMSGFRRRGAMRSLQG